MEAIVMRCLIFFFLVSATFGADAGADYAAVCAKADAMRDEALRLQGEWAIHWMETADTTEQPLPDLPDDPRESDKKKRDELQRINNLRHMVSHGKKQVAVLDDQAKEQAVREPEQGYDPQKAAKRATEMKYKTAIECVEKMRDNGGLALLDRSPSVPAATEKKEKKPIVGGFTNPQPANP